MMKRESFTYNDKVRDVLVTEEDEHSIKGIDLSSAPEKERERILEVAKTIDPEGWKKEDVARADVMRLRESGALKFFRHFKRSAVKKSVGSD
jgi:hypothetical protein